MKNSRKAIAIILAVIAVSCLSAAVVLVIRHAKRSFVPPPKS